MDIDELVHQIPEGYSEAILDGRKYGITRSDFNDGKSLKVFARDLGGNDFISFNYYKLSSGIIKPCEMPIEKVIAFLEAFKNNQ